MKLSYVIMSLFYCFLSLTFDKIINFFAYYISGFYAGFDNLYDPNPIGDVGERSNLVQSEICACA